MILKVKDLRQALKGLKGETDIYIDNPLQHDPLDSCHIKEITYYKGENVCAITLETIRTVLSDSSIIRQL